MPSKSKILFLVIVTITINQLYAILQSPIPLLETYKQWNLLTYDFTWDAPVNDKKFYNPEQIIATGIDFDQSRIFIATPRLLSGVPATLSTISRLNSGDSPVLHVNNL